MKIQIAAALAATGLLAACQPAAEQPQPKEAISVAGPAATPTVPAVAPTEVASATAPTRQATPAGQKAAEPVKATPARERGRPSQNPNVSPSQTKPPSAPMPGHDMPGHDMSTMPDMSGMVDMSWPGIS